MSGPAHLRQLPEPVHPARDTASWLARTFIVAAGVAAYSNSFRGEFIFDDEQSIVDNPHITRLWPLSDALSAPPQSTVSGRPVVSLTLAVNYALGGRDPFGYHIFNLGVHLLNALLLFGLVRRTLVLSDRRPADLKPAGGRSHNGFDLRSIRQAAAVALIWVVHPLTTAAVTYVIQRAESLVAFFYLATLYGALRGWTATRSTNERPAPGWHVPAILACGLGMATKEVMVTAPLVVMLFDAVFVSNSWRGLLRRSRMLYVGLAATWLILAWLNASAPRSESVALDFVGLSPWEYARSQFGVLVHYFKRSFWPAGLCLDYGWPVARTAREIVPPMLVILILLAAAAAALARRSPAGFVGAAFFLILSPSSTVVPIVDCLAFDHRMYLPLAALVAGVVVGVFALWNRHVGTEADVAEPRRGALGAMLVAMIVVALGAATWRRNADYRTAESIWSDVIRKRPANARGHANLATLLVRRGEFDAAIASLRRALELQPRYAGAHNELGHALLRQGKLAEARAHVEQALALRPGFPEALSNMAHLLYRAGRLDEARTHLEQAVRQRPYFYEAQANLGIVLAAQGRLDEAISRFRESLRYSPGYELAHYQLARALAAQGRRDEARDEYRRVLELNPGHHAAREQLERLTESQSQRR